MKEIISIKWKLIFKKANGQTSGVCIGNIMFKKRKKSLLKSGITSWQLLFSCWSQDCFHYIRLHWVPPASSPPALLPLPQTHSSVHNNTVIVTTPTITKVVVVVVVVIIIIIINLSVSNDDDVYSRIIHRVGKVLPKRDWCNWRTKW